MATILLLRQVENAKTMPVALWLFCMWNSLDVLQICVTSDLTAFELDASIVLRTTELISATDRQKIGYMV